MRDWQMDISEGYPSGVDVRALMHEVRPQIRKKLTEQISAPNGTNFQLALKVQLQKESPDLTEESKGLLTKAYPPLGAARKVDTERVGVTADRVQTLWLDIARYQPLRGSSYIPLPAAVRS